MNGPPLQVAIGGECLAQPGHDLVAPQRQIPQKIHVWPVLSILRLPGWHV